jgi:hypothetical protein
LQFLDGPKPPNIDPKFLKFHKKHKIVNVRQNNIFQHYVFSIFRRFGVPKRIPNPDFFKLFRKPRLGENPYKTLPVRRKIKVRILKNYQKIDSTTRSAKASRKTSPE